VKHEVQVVSVNLHVLQLLIHLLHLFFDESLTHPSGQSVRHLLSYRNKKSPIPHCVHLLGFSTQARQVLEQFRQAPAVML
jgi:hypothetical protein